MQSRRSTDSFRPPLPCCTRVEGLLQTITAAQIQAARTIWSYWCRRFKHNTLWQLIDRTRKLGIVNEDTSTMGLDGLNDLIESDQVLLAMHRLFKRLIVLTSSKMSQCNCARALDLTPEYTRKLILMFAIRKYEETGLLEDDDPELVQDVVDASNQMIHCFFSITNTVHRLKDLDRVEKRFKTKFGCLLVKYINAFIAWTSQRSERIRRKARRATVGARTQAASTIARYWRIRFKRNTLCLLIDRARRVGISLESTSRMSVRTLEKFTGAPFIQRAMHHLLCRLLFLTDADFRRNGLKKDTDCGYTKRVLFSFMLFHFPENDCLHYLDSMEAQCVLKSVHDFVLAFTSITDQFYTRKDLKLVDSSLRNTFGDIVYDLFKKIGAWCDKYNAGRTGEILASLQSVCRKGVNGKHPNFIESKIQELRDEYTLFHGEYDTFDVKLKEIRCSMDIMQRIGALYDNAPSPRNLVNIEALRSLYKRMNGQDSLQKFDAANRVRMGKHYEEQQQRRKKTTVEEEGSSNKKKTALPPPPAADVPSDDNTTITKEDTGKKLEIPPDAFESAVERTHALIDRLKARESVDPLLSTAELFSTPIHHYCKWAKIHVDVLPKSSSSFFPDSNNPISSAVFKHCILDYKATEYTLTIASSSTTTIFDLGDAFPQFRRCRLIHRISHGLFSMALVETKFAPHLVFTQGVDNCRMLLGAANETIRVVAECSDDGGAASRNVHLSFVLVELKFCAACGRPAKNKCTACWGSCRACVRYCSKECFRGDYKRHKEVCGRDFSDMWKSAAFYP